VSRVATALVACALAFGCSKKKDKPAPPPDQRPPPITVEEKTRNADACTAYVDQICACAKAHPDKAEVVELCRSDTPLPAALSLSMATAENPASTRNDLLLTQAQARKIATSCLDQTAKLPSLGCP
jgi:hypothetical protein